MGDREAGSNRVRGRTFQTGTQFGLRLEPAKEGRLPVKICGDCGEELKRIQKIWICENVDCRKREEASWRDQLE